MTFTLEPYDGKPSRTVLRRGGHSNMAFLSDWGLDRDYYLGNALKYISRAGRKGDFKEDIQKAIWYLERRLQTLE